jgi:hypothetical protein
VVNPKSAEACFGAFFVRLFIAVAGHCSFKTTLHLGRIPFSELNGICPEKIAVLPAGVKGCPTIKGCASKNLIAGKGKKKCHSNGMTF